MARVRIRKAGPGETAGYYNKASMFLKKAQMGAEVQEPQNQAAAQNDQAAVLKAYYEYAYDQLIKDVSIDDVLGQLVSKGLPQQIAYDLVNTLVDELTDRGQLNPDYKRKKEQEEASQEEQPQAEGNQTITEDWKENYGPNASSDQQEEDQSMYEEDQDMADLEEGYIADDSHLMARGGFFQQGGMNNPALQQYDDVKNSDTEKFDFQKLIEDTPGVQPGLNFPSLKEYIPAYSGGSWEDVEALDEPLYRRGGNVPSKKQFVKNVMTLLKKQAGGEQEPQAAQEEQKPQALGKGPRMDTLTEDVKKHRDNFLGAIKEKATKIKTEEMYDKLMQSDDPEMQQLAMQGQQQPMQQPMQQPYQMGGYTGGEDPLYKFIGGGMELDNEANTDPSYYEADYLPEAKYGHSVGNLIRASRGLSGPGGMNPDEYPPKQATQPTAPKPQPNMQMQPEPEMRMASPRYVPTYGGYNSSALRHMLPWNPMVTKSMQMVGSPYVAGTRTPYRDPLHGMTPVARQVTKRGLFGQPKKYTDFYAAVQMANSPLPYQGKQILLADNNMLRFVNPSMPTQMGTPNFDFSDSKGLELGSRAAILAGEMGARRNQRRLERNPELLESSAPKMPYINTSYLPDPATIDQRVFDQNDPNFLMQPWEGPVNTNEIPGGSAMTAYAYGGALNRFIPKAAPGIEVQNPSLPQPAPGNPDMTMGSQPGLLGNPVQGPGTLWNAQASFNQPAPTSSAVTAYNSNPANNMPVEPAGENLTNCTPEQKRDTTSKCYCSPEARKDPNNKRCFDSMVGVDVEQKRNVDTEAALNIGNAAVRGVTNFLGRGDQKRQEQQMYDNMTTDNLYASQGTKHRGDWVDLGSMAGQYRFDQMGQDRSSFSSYGKYGGYMQEGGELDYLSSPAFAAGDYNAEDEVYMSDEDIKNFMANGGQIEYLED